MSICFDLSSQVIWMKYLRLFGVLWPWDSSFLEKLAMCSVTYDMQG